MSFRSNYLLTFPTKYAVIYRSLGRVIRISEQILVLGKIIHMLEIRCSCLYTTGCITLHHVSRYIETLTCNSNSLSLGS